MLKDGILEESHSAYINPITLVVHERKAVHICLDARRINKQMVVDRTKVMSMREVTSLDLSSAFLQVPLEKSSRQWTEFQFASNVYQFTTVSYGFKNSLAAFIRALGKIWRVVCFLLGNSPASEFCMPTFRNTVCSIFIGG
jgi:hypothetical protein